MAAEEQASVERLNVLSGEDPVIKQIGNLALASRIRGDKIASAHAFEEQRGLELTWLRDEWDICLEEVKAEIDSADKGYKAQAEETRRTLAERVADGNISPELVIYSEPATRSTDRKPFDDEAAEHRVERYRQLQPGTVVIICGAVDELAHNRGVCSGVLAEVPKVIHGQATDTFTLQATIKGGQKISIGIDNLSSMAIGGEDAEKAISDWWDTRKDHLPVASTQDFKEIISLLAKLEPIRAEVPYLKTAGDQAVEYYQAEVDSAINQANPSSYQVECLITTSTEIAKLRPEGFDRLLMTLARNPNFRSWDVLATRLAMMMNPDWHRFSEEQQQEAEILAGRFLIYLHSQSINPTTPQKPVPSKIDQ